MTPGAGEPGDSSSPADGRLAVGRPLGGAQRLAHLRLGQAQRQAADLEGLGELPDLLQVHPIHLAGRTLGIYHTQGAGLAL